MPWPQTGATHHYALLELPDKGCTIKGFIVYYVLWLGSMRGFVSGLVQGSWIWFGKDGYRAQISQHPIET